MNDKEQLWNRVMRLDAEVIRLRADVIRLRKGDPLALPGEDISVDSVGFSVRTLNVLNLARLFSLADLYSVPKLARLKGMGPGGLREIVAVLEEFRLPPIPNLRIRRANQLHEGKDSETIG